MESTQTAQAAPRKSRAWIAWLVLAVVIIVVIVLAITLRGQKEPDVVRIGAILPLTGSAAPYGKNAQRGIDLALEEINDVGGIDGKRVEVIYEDGRTESDVGVTALRRMIDIEKIPFIIGDINSTSVLAMAPIAEREHVILLSPGASNPKISDAGEYIFRNWHSDALEGEVDADFAYNELGWRKAAVLYVTEGYGVGLAEVFKAKFEEHGGKIASYEGYPRDATNMRDQIAKIIASDADGLFLPGWPKEMSVALRQLKQIGSELPILSVQGFDDPSILQLAGAAAEGVIFSVPENPDPNNPVVKHFNEAYEERYGMEPGVCSASGYDALKIYGTIIGDVGYSVEKVRDKMAVLEDFPGADGPIDFDEHGDLLKPFMFKIARSGRFEVYE